MITAKTTAKQTARAVRIWIEGAKPAASGFTPDASFSITHGDGFISLTLDPNGSRRVTKATRNGKARPIIDLAQRRGCGSVRRWHTDRGCIP